MYRGSSPSRNTHQADRSARAIHPLFICLIGIGGFQPMILVFAADRCPATNATKFVSVQGKVTWSVISNATLNAAKLNDLLCVGDTVRVGGKSRAVLRLPNETTIPLDQNTIFQLKEAISEKDPTLIELLQGAIHVITRTPKPFKVNTPYLNAVVEGTEFYVGVDSAEARVAVIEGKVNVSNEQGAVLLIDNEAATARKGQAPQKTLTIKPRDAVQWALYYPPLFDPRSRSGGQNLSASHDLYSQGKITEAIESLNAIPEAERGGDFYSYRAGLLLLVGRADEAEPDIETALRENGNNTDALSLKALIAIVKNDKAKALELANQATIIDDKSASARIALSYALQASFKIEDALKAAREATLRDADNALAWARVAELELSIPNYDKSKEAAEKAVKLNPNLARTQSVLGFANLTRIDIKAAKENFNRAIELDQADPLPRLGAGLAVIREGNLEQGREQIEIAASLDPENSLIRSYLGKAYYEERRLELAGTQLNLAKKLDVNDPIPWFYDAVNKQESNRQVLGLVDLERSIELNDHRAPFRPPLRLDQDTAAKNVEIARIFSDLGFGQLGLRRGNEAVAVDPTSTSGHRLVSEMYAALPRHEIARVSELLQAQLLDPLPASPIPARLAEASLRFVTGPSEPGHNEFSPLFVRGRTGLRFSGIAGSHKTFGDEFAVSRSTDWSLTSFGQFHFESNGTRENSQIRQDVFNLFVQGRVGVNTSIQGEIRESKSTQGDLLERFDRSNFSRDFSQSDKAQSIRLGLRHSLFSNSLVLGSLNFRKVHTAILEPSTFLDAEFSEKGVLGELQNIYTHPRFSLTTGIGHFSSNRNDVQRFPPDEVRSNFDVRHSILYSYSQLRISNQLFLVFGASGDFFEQESLVKVNQFNPKMGFIWVPTSKLSVRGAAFRGLKRVLTSDQTIEPTQVAGFNQFFDEPNGTESQNYGAAVDLSISTFSYAGITHLQRKLQVPVILGQPPAERVNWDERVTRAYYYIAPTEKLGLAAEYEFEEVGRNPRVNINGVVDSSTHRISFNASYFPTSSKAIRISPTLVRQSGVFIDTNFDPIDGRERFWVLDAELAHRFTKGWGSILFGAKNILDRQFNYQQDFNPVIFTQPRIFPRRFIYLRLAIGF